jgi:predicted GNAT superfamily acetyltransferase
MTPVSSKSTLTAEADLAPAAAPPVLRALVTAADLRACVSLQREIWGGEYDEIVPPSLIRAALRVGAVALGAFGPDGTLLGFVFGFTGVKDGEVVHWSHMLGVSPAARDQGLGRRLKELQRAELARRGVARIYWTFDPLQSRNAHLNLNVLGARVVDYVVDMYGDSRSPLHQAVGTDRLIVEWPTSPAAVEVVIDDAGAASPPLLTPFARAGDVPPAPGAPARLWVETPWDLQEVVATSAAVAREWRVATRQYFQWALATGYRVARLHRDVAARRAFYVLERT